MPRSTAKLQDDSSVIEGELRALRVRLQHNNTEIDRLRHSSISAKTRKDSRFDAFLSEDEIRTALLEKAAARSASSEGDPKERIAVLERDNVSIQQEIDTRTSALETLADVTTMKKKNETEQFDNNLTTKFDDVADKINGGVGVFTASIDFILQQYEYESVQAVTKSVVTGFTVVEIILAFMGMCWDLFCVYHNKTLSFVNKFFKVIGSLFICAVAFASLASNTLVVSILSAIAVLLGTIKDLVVPWWEASAKKIELEQKTDFISTDATVLTQLNAKEKDLKNKMYVGLVGVVGGGISFYSPALISGLSILLAMAALGLVLRVNYCSQKLVQLQDKCASSCAKKETDIEMAASPKHSANKQTKSGSSTIVAMVNMGTDTISYTSLNGGDLYVLNTVVNVDTSAEAPAYSPPSIVEGSTLQPKF